MLLAAPGGAGSTPKPGPAEAVPPLPDLLETEVGPVAKPDHLPLPVGQPPDGDQQLPEEDAVLSLPGRVLPLAQRPAQLLLGPVPDAGPPVVVEDRVAGDPEKPGGRGRGTRLEAVVSLVGAHEHLRRHVLGLRRVAKLAEGVAVDARQELAVEILELGPRRHAATG